MKRRKNMRMFFRRTPRDAGPKVEYYLGKDGKPFDLYKENN